MRLVISSSDVFDSHGCFELLVSPNYRIISTKYPIPIQHTHTNILVYYINFERRVYTSETRIIRTVRMCWIVQMSTTNASRLQRHTKNERFLLIKGSYTFIMIIRSLLYSTSVQSKLESKIYQKDSLVDRHLLSINNPNLESVGNKAAYENLYGTIMREKQTSSQA